MEGLSSQESSPSSLSAARPERSPQRSSRGSSTITGQIRLKPKPSRSPGPRLDEVTSITPPGSDSFAEKQNGSALQPIDGGLAAWSYVVGAFAMYIVVWGNAVMVVLAKTAFAEDLGLGFPQAFPIFQAHLSTGPSADYPDSAIIRLLAPGIQDIEEGILFQLLPKANKHRRTLAIMGIAIITAAVFLASCSTSDWQVVLTQGVVFGVGGILLNFVHVSIFPEWFDRKKGQAMGIIWMGYRLGGLAFPPLCQWLLEKHGYAQCMRVLIAPMLALLLPSIVLLRGRYHSATVISQGPEPSVSKVQALRQPHVLFYLITVLLVDMVTNVPFMFIATFAADLQLSRADQALAFSLVQISNIIASYGSGWLSDQGFHEELLAGIALASSLVHFLLWGFCKSKFALFVYALATGLVGGGKTTILPREKHAAYDGQAILTVYFLSLEELRARTTNYLQLFIASSASLVDLQFSP